MLTDKQTAAQISTLMLELGARLDASVVLVKDTCSESEFAEYKQAIGKLMGSMLFDVMNPLYKAHPELKPKELE